ncbi:MAG TPA: serine/threonine-protein kinase [Archangium sp.]|nr:serine/threonine-protein kinase [Archangium sp.]
MKRLLHPDQLRPGHRVRHYRVVRRLGSGGFSTVLLVEHQGRPFSMKMAARPPSPEDEARVDERAVREAVVLGHFRHPHLPKVYATGRWPDADSGYFFVVTEYIPGCTFNRWRWKTQSSLRRQVEEVAEVARVLAELHERGVVHRDLKADNLLIREGDEKIFLTDFGSAFLPGAYTLTQVLPPTTFHNLPPECATFLINGEWEQGARLSATPAMDLYGLGALLYEALTDCHPFSPRLPQAKLLLAIESVVPKEPLLLDPRVPPGLNDLTMRLLAKKPELRPPSARAVHEELMRMLEAEGDTEHWKRPYAFAAREEEPLAPSAETAAPEASAPARQTADARKEPRKPGLWWKALLVLAVTTGLLGVGWSQVREECVSAFELACSGAGSTEKGSHSLFPSRRADDTLSQPHSASSLCTWLGACAAAANLLGCASAPVRPEMEPLLAQCPLEARQTASRLGLRSIMQVQLVNVTEAGPEHHRATVNIKSGPVQGELIVNDEDFFKVTGEAKVFPDRVYIYFDRLHPTPEGPPVPFCGAALNDDRNRFGVETWAVMPQEGALVDPARVDRSPDAAVLNFPIVFTYIQGPDNKFRPRVIIE